MCQKIALLLCIGLLCWSCRKASTSQERVINVTIEPERYLVEAIAGDKYKVNTLVPVGSNPEIYEPTPRQMVELGKGELYFRIGNIGFEQLWMGRIRQNAPHLKIYDLSEGILSHTKGQYEDPHIWTSVVNMRKMAKTVSDVLCKEDPQNETYYKERTLKLLQRLDALDKDFRKRLKNLSNRSFLIYHPTLTYFAKDYGLEQIAIEKEDKEPTPSSVRATIEECRRKNVRLILLQQQFDTKNTQLIAAQLKVRTVVFDPLSYQWEETLRAVVQSFTH